MAKITNIKDLGNMVNQYIVKAMELTRDKIFEVVSRKVSDYYHEDVFAHAPADVPDYYQRTGNLMESLTASNIIKNGNMFEFCVGWDDEYLTFRYPGGFVKKGSRGKDNHITGLQVLQAFNSGTHGYTVQGSHNYFDEAIKEINTQYGSITDLFKLYCKKIGMPIK